MSNAITRHRIGDVRFQVSFHASSRLAAVCSVPVGVKLTHAWLSFGANGLNGPGRSVLAQF